MFSSVCHEYLNLASFFASVIGLYLLYTDRSPEQREKFDDPDTLLMAMSFAYWIVHCVAIGAQKWVLPEWESVLLSLKFAAVLSYLLTFSCILSLPLNRIADRQQQI
jgi:hypothetical protein